MKTNKVVTSERVVMTCDLCGQPMDPCTKPCVGCGRDACPQCHLLLDADPMTREPCYVDGHAFPCCKQCFGITQGFIIKAGVLRQSYDDAADTLRRAWQEACKRAIK